MKLIYFLFFMIVLGMSFTLAQVPPPVPPIQFEWTIAGTTQNQQLGSSVSGIGDVNGDGLGDVAIGSPSPCNPCTPASPTPSVTVHDGLSGQIIYTIPSPVPTLNNPVFGISIAGIGDVDGDVASDIAILSGGSFNGGALYVYSGLTGALLWSSVNVGISSGSNTFDLIGIPDVNGNNIPDVALLVFTGGVGTVSVFDGAGTTPLYTFTNPSIGYSLAGLSDVDGDGISDFAAGGVPSTTGNGVVTIYSGATGGLISSIPDTTPASGYFGEQISSTDFNGDGLLDVIIGERQGIISTASRVHVVSLSGGQQTYIQSINVIANFVSVAGLKDANGDGYGDILIGSGTGFGNTNQVLLYSGQTGGLINTFVGPPVPNTFSSPSFGGYLDDAGDINGDGLSDIVIGDYSAQSATTGQSGRAFVYRLGGVRSYGYGSLSIFGSASLIWTPQINTPSMGQFFAYGVQPNTNGILIMSNAPAYTPLPPPLTPLFVDFNSPNPIFTAQIQFDNNGIYTSPVFNILAPSIAGNTVYIQVANIDSLGNVLGLTNPLQVTYVA